MIFSKMKTVKDLLKNKLTGEELSLVPSSFDVVGDILIFADFPSGLKKKEKLIAKSFLRFFKNLKVVCKKTKQYSGAFRTPKLKILAGEKRKETVYRENNCMIKLNVERCYFSPRLGNERKRIASLVKPNETILVMFSGVAPYPLVISKNSKAKLICGVEKNPVAHKYAEENVKLNRVKNIRLSKGDARLVVPKMKMRFDRLLMPLPKGAETFLRIAIPKVKKGGTLHFYDFLEEQNFRGAELKVKDCCRKLKRRCRILRTVKCGQYGPGKFRVCVDARI